MIAVVGNPLGRRVLGAIVAAGLPAAIARNASAAGSTVQVIGKVGDGPAGDAILLSLATDGVGHVALLRDQAPASIEAEDAEGDDPDRPIDELAGFDGPVDADGDGPAPATVRPPAMDASGPSLDAADIALALDYLPDYRVVVVAQSLDAEALAATVAAARWSGAQLIVVASSGRGSDASLPEDATVLEAPDDDAEGAFASVVGRYAAALDAGTAPGEAFAAASGATGWTAAAD